MKTPGERLYQRVKYLTVYQDYPDMREVLKKYEEETCCSTGTHDPTWHARDRGDEIRATLVVAREAAGKLGRMIPQDSSQQFRSAFLTLMRALEQEL